MPRPGMRGALENRAAQMRCGAGGILHAEHVGEAAARCFDYAEVELSNNLAENSMRSRWVARTGCTSAVLRAAPRSP